MDRSEWRQEGRETGKLDRGRGGDYHLEGLAIGAGMTSSS